MIHLKKYCLILLLAFISSTVFSQEKTQLTTEEFEKAITSKCTLLDVRTAAEYKTAHITKSLQADWTNKQEFADRLQYVDKNLPLYVYCAAGGRSAAAAKWLRNNGYTQVFELTGGMVNWQNAGKPVEKDLAVKQYTIEEYNNLLTGNDPVLIDFGATWCPPCKKMEPVLQQLHKEHPGNVKVVAVDAGVHTDVMKQLQVTSLPTFILYKNGKEVWRAQGIQTLNDIKKAIKG